MPGNHASDGFQDDPRTAPLPATPPAAPQAGFSLTDHPEGEGWALAADAFEPAPRPAWQVAQVRLALDYLTRRGHQHDAARRAAVILMADAEAPVLERALGAYAVRAIGGEPVRGMVVTCRACRRQWDCQPEDPYYDADDATSGLCGGCLMAASRTEDAEPVLTGEVVSPADAGQ